MTDEEFLARAHLPPTGPARPAPPPLPDGPDIDDGSGTPPAPSVSLAGTRFAARPQPGASHSPPRPQAPAAGAPGGSDEEFLARAHLPPGAAPGAAAPSGPAAPAAPAPDNQGFAGIANDFRQHPIESMGLYANPATQLPMVAQRFLAPGAADALVDFHRAGTHSASLGLDEKAAGALGAASGGDFAASQAEQRDANAQSRARSPMSATAGTVVGAFGAPVPGVGRLAGLKGAAGVVSRVGANAAIGSGIGATTAWAGDRPIAPAAAVGGAVGAGGGLLVEAANGLAGRAGDLFNRWRGQLAASAQRPQEAGQVVEGTVVGRGVRPASPRPPPALPQTSTPPHISTPGTVHDTAVEPAPSFLQPTQAAKAVRGDEITQPLPRYGGAAAQSPPRPAAAVGAPVPPVPSRPAAERLISAYQRRGVIGGRAPSQPLPAAEMSPRRPAELIIPPGPADEAIARAPGEMLGAMKAGAAKGAIGFGGLGAVLHGPGGAIKAAAGGAAVGAGKALGELVLRNPAAKAYIAKRAQSLLQTDPEKAQRLFQVLESDRR